MILLTTAFDFSDLIYDSTFEVLSVGEIVYGWQDLKAESLILWHHYRYSCVAVLFSIYIILRRYHFCPYYQRLWAIAHFFIVILLFIVLKPALLEFIADWLLVPFVFVMGAGGQAVSNGDLFQQISIMQPNLEASSSGGGGEEPPGASSSAWDDVIKQDEPERRPGWPSDHELQSWEFPGQEQGNDQEPFQLPDEPYSEPEEEEEDLMTVELNSTDFWHSLKQQTDTCSFFEERIIVHEKWKLDILSQKQELPQYDPEGCLVTKDDINQVKENLYQAERWLTRCQKLRNDHIVEIVSLENRKYYNKDE